ncbi:hypothetical protein BC629DRAFT_1463815 [Irpex lacteus]|nr:hypothetical protein BC629DRAFT_1463815 [Irpex lacteus]
MFANTSVPVDAACSSCSCSSASCNTCTNGYVPPPSSNEGYSEVPSISQCTCKPSECKC